MPSDLMPEMSDADYIERQQGEYDQGRYAIALRLLGDVSGKRVFDFGCGDGSFIRKLNSMGAIASGCDPSEELAHHANAICGGVEILEQQRDLDVVLALSVTSFMQPDELPRFWPAVRTALKPGGLLLHSVTNTWASQQNRQFGADPRTFPAMLKTHGLEEIAQDFYGYLPMPWTRALKSGDKRVFSLPRLAMIPTALKQRRCTMYFSLSCKLPSAA